MSEKKIRVFNTITAQDLQGKGAKTLAIRPNEPANYGQGSLSGRQLQLRFDSLADLVINRYNEMANGISSSDALEYFYLPKIDGDQITLGTGADEKVDLSSFIKKISDKAGDLVVETPYEKSSVTTIKSILAQIYSDLQEIDADLQLHSSDKDADGNTVTTAHPDIRDQIGKDIALHNSDKDADGKDVTDTHPSIRGLIPTKIDEHNISTDAHEDIRKEIDDDIDSHNKATDTHQDIRDKIGTDISTHNTSTTAHSDIRDLINGITGTDGRLTELEKVVNSFLNDAVDSDNAIENLKEIIAYIELNRSKIDDIIKVDGLLSQKIDKASIVTNLTTNDSSKVLAASVGEVITEAINQAVTDKVTNNSLSKTLSEYLKKGELGDIIRPEDLKNYIDVNELAEALKPYAKTNDIVIPDVSGFIDTNALNKALEDYAKTGDIPDVSNFIDTNALNNALKDYVKSGDIDLDDYLTINDLTGYAKETDDAGYAVVRTNDLADYAKTTTTDGGTVVRTNDLSSTLENYALSSDLEGYAPLVDEFARNVAYDNPEDPFITTAVLDSRLENIVVGGGGGDIAVDGDTLGDNEDGAVEVQAVRCAHNEDEEYEDRQFLKFFVGTKDEYDSLNDKSGVLAIIKEQGMPTSAQIKEAVQYLTNIRNGTPVQKAIADENGNNIKDTYAKETVVVKENGKDISHTVVRETAETPVARMSDLSNYAQEVSDSGTIVRENSSTPVARRSDLKDITKYDQEVENVCQWKGRRSHIITGIDRYDKVNCEEGDIVCIFCNRTYHTYLVFVTSNGSRCEVYKPAGTESAYQYKIVRVNSSDGYVTRARLYNNDDEITDFTFDYRIL